MTMITNSEVSSKTGIDSLKLRLPILDVRIIDKSLLNYWSEVELETGEIDPSTYKLRAKAIESNGIKTKYLICRGNKITDECVAVLFNSKLLKSRYLEGITKENIAEVHSELMNQKIIFCPLAIFLEGLVSDCDIKKDVELETLEAQKACFAFLEKITKLSKNKRGGLDTHKKGKNLGVQWSKRDVANTTHPHAKIYAKDIELLYNSKEFFRAHLKSVQPGLTRIEVTIKNEKHFKSLFGKEKKFTLENVLNSEEAEINKAFELIFEKHLDIYSSPQEKEMETKTTTTMTDILSKALLRILKSYELALNVAKLYVPFGNRSQRYQVAKVLEKNWQEMSEKEKPKHSDSIEKLMANILFTEKPPKPYS